MIRTRLLRPEELAPHVNALRALETSISYPLGDGKDAFTLDHGPRYHPFFSDQGDALFLLAFDGSELVGGGVGIFKPAALDGVIFPTVYLCDVKVAAGHRGRGISHRLHGEALARALVTPELRRFRLAWGVAMRGSRGDVRRTWTPGHVGRLADPLAVLALYFVPPETLAALDVSGCPPPPQRGILDLSVAVSAPAHGGMVSTAGKKDLRLVSTGLPLPLVHLTQSPAFCRPSYGAYLREMGARLVASGSRALTCFALDTRVSGTIAWLAERGIVSDTSATVVGLCLPGARRGLVHLATSDI